MVKPITINKHVYLAQEMMGMRLKLNRENHQLLKELCYEEWEKCKEEVTRLAGKEINVGSSKQVQDFLYKDLGLKEKKKRGRDTTTADENALRELQIQSPQHKEILDALIKERHIKKKIESYIEIQVDEDGYIPYSANPAGTETNRWSFSKSPRNRGFNVQTAPKVMRIMVDSPPGRVFICPDLPQADARIVAWDAECLRLINLFNDPKAHFHLENVINISKATGKPIPREVVYGKVGGIPWKEREHSLYTLYKSMGHAANYRMQARKLAMELGCNQRDAQRALDAYHMLYPEIYRWQVRLKERIKKEGGLWTPMPFHRFRTFHTAWGSLMLTGKMSETLWNEACAYIPQSAVADIINYGMEKLWEELDGVRFHKHDHDSYLASVPGGDLGNSCRRGLHHLRVPLVLHDRELIMEPDMQVGINYGQMVEWKGEETLQEILPRLEKKMVIDREKIRKELYGHC